MHSQYLPQHFPTSIGECHVCRPWGRIHSDPPLPNHGAENVRRALQPGKRDRIQYTICPGGEVVLTQTEPTNDDPVLSQFLGFLARDIATDPERLQTVDAGLAQRLHSLVSGIEVDLDAALPASDE